MKLDINTIFDPHDKFGDIQVGECFERDQSIYIKIPTVLEKSTELTFQAVRLSSGKLHWFDDDSDIIKRPDLCIVKIEEKK